MASRFVRAVRITPASEISVDALAAVSADEIFSALTEPIDIARTVA